MPLKPWHLDDWMAFTIAAARVRDEKDRQLGELMLTAAKTDAEADWSAVHDYLNVMADFASADRLRKAIEALRV